VGARRCAIADRLAVGRLRHKQEVIHACIQHSYPAL
jgi:hypothetical protein